MDASVLTVLVLFATVLLRVAIVAACVWLFIPRRRTCPHCGEPTERLVTARVWRALRLERRWCMQCGWSGIAKRTVRRVEPTAAPASSITPLVVCAVGLAVAGCTQDDPVARLFADPDAWIDLTYSFDDRTIYWPTAEAFALESVAAGRTAAGYYYEANNFQAAEHGGTHLDAPIHFAAGKYTADEIPLAQLVGPAVVIDVSADAARDADYRVGVADLEAFETGHGRIPDGAIVLIKTGWGARWPDPEAYLGTARRGPEAVPELHFPGIHPDAARWLVDRRRIDAVGIDTPSIDFGQSTTFESHQVFYGANIPGFENVANLNRLPPTGAYVIALPMKIDGGSGAPLRVVGVVPPSYPGPTAR